ncbi:acyltransferase family protein [Candidatus Pristimantibacillus sp. PTI5]|uniref:acyltransferase family protein n=1 Tax=Candidatus Pristimantibacillus sp. PTI5 TaxID=3400422 RepID=UPI003B0180F1
MVLLFPRSPAKVILPVLDKPNYNGLDWLKFATALLVVANHTGPLHAYHAYADFLLSGVLTRIAVPLFFMSTGFFFFRKLSGDPSKDHSAFLAYIKKITVLYGIAILLYLPLNVYKGYFSESFTPLALLKDLIFNGTFYHLWYLPALIIGLGLTYAMYRKMSLPKLLMIGVCLYSIGLLGDSYYGLTVRAAGLHQLYESMFLVFDYTRNGIFYAPIYIMLGAYAAKRPAPAIKPKGNASLFFLGLVLMLAEGILLKAAEYPRHDSMYVFALPAAYFLFQWALSWNASSGKAFREWRVWIYILHPIAIVLVRGAAEAAKLETLFIANSVMHFVTVCLVSVVMAAAAVRLSVIKFKFRP